MPVLAFRHVPFEHLGLIAPALESGSLEFEYVDPNSGDVRELDSLPDPHAHAARMAEIARLVFGRWAALVVEKHH